MDSELVTGLEERRARPAARAAAVAALGPLTVLGGALWALAQPYRLTLLSPREHGFWELAVQPPLLVVAVGVLFALLVAPGVLEDLEEADR